MLHCTIGGPNNYCIAQRRQLRRELNDRLFRACPLARGVFEAAAALFFAGYLIQRPGCRGIHQVFQAEEDSGFRLVEAASNATSTACRKGFNPLIMPIGISGALDHPPGFFRHT